MLRQLEEKTLVSGQLTPEDLPGLQSQGVTLIVNNRAVGEDADQPRSSALEEAAGRLGIEYRFNPITRGLGPADVAAMRDAIRDCGDGKMVAFCRSGTRSTLAWAVARAEDGVPREELDRIAAGAGVDLGPVSHLL